MGFPPEQGLDAQRLPALRLAVLLASGIWLARQGAIPLQALGLALAFSLLAALFLRSRGALGNLAGDLAVMLLVLSTGALVYSLEQKARAGKLDALPPESALVGLIGRVEGPGWSDPPAYGALPVQRCIFRVHAELCPGDNGWKAADYRLMLNLRGGSQAALYGDERLAVLARVRPPGGFANPGGFDYREYLLGQSVIGVGYVDQGNYYPLDPSDPGLAGMLDPWRWAARLRALLVRRHLQLYPDRQVRAVVSALLVGAREQVPRILEEQFALSGTVHVLVVSGLHVGFVAGTVFFLLALFFGRGWFSSVGAVLSVALYAMLSGGRPSVVRAAVMCAFVLLALPLQRKRCLLNTLAASFALMLLVRPGWLFDVGFQLSFAAVTGIGLLLPRFEALFSDQAWWESRFKRWAARLALVSLCAQIGITPLVAWYFFRVSPVGLAANLVMVPLAGAAVLAGFAADLVSMVWLGAAKFAALPATWAVQAMTFLAGIFASLPGAYLEVSPPRAWEALFLWAAAYYAPALPSALPARGGLALAALLWLNCRIWSGLAPLWQDRLELCFLDLGDSRAVALHLPGGGRVLVDAATSGEGSDLARDQVIPYLLRHGGRKLEALVIRTADPGYIHAASAVAERFEVGALVLPPVKSAAPFYGDFLGRCLDREIRLRTARSGDTLKIGETSLVFLWPDRECTDPDSRLENTDNCSLCLRVDYRGKSVLLAGALTGFSWSRLLERGFAQEGCAVIEWPSTASPPDSVQTGTVVISSRQTGFSPLDRKASLLETSRLGAVTVLLGKEGLEFRTARRTR